MKIIDPDKLTDITIETTNTGFTIWITENKERYWLVDGSLLKVDGKIRLGGRFTKQKYRPVYNRKTKTIELKQVNCIKEDN